MNAAPARVFVGLALPAELATPLAEAAARALPARSFRLARADGLHLTLVFLGNVAPERLGPLEAALVEACAPLAAPRLELDAPGGFPALEAARVLWVGVRELAPGRLVAVREAVLGACARTGLPLAAAERERFHPHLTLARPRARSAAAPAPFLELVPRGRFTATEAVLFESRREAGGTRYLARARAGFGAIS